jgi:hypothetical protein
MIQMNKILVLISQAYLNFASYDVLKKISKYTTIILFIHESEEVLPNLSGCISKIYKIKGSIKSSLRPVFDADEICQKLSLDIDNIYGNDDVSVFCQQEDNVLVAAQVRQFFALAGDYPDLVTLFRDKVLMKNHLSQAMKNHVPKFEILDLERIEENTQDYYQYLVDNLGHKMVLKPTSAAGSFNVKIISSYRDLCDAIKIVKDENYQFQYEIDEYISGKMYQCDSLVYQGEVLYSGISELNCTNFEFVQGSPLAIYLVSDPDLYRKLYDFNQEVIKNFGFRNGSTHHEIFVSDQGEPIFLEIAARVPGGIGVPFHQANNEINLIDENLLMLTLPAEMMGYVECKTCHTVLALLPVGHGRVVALNEPNLSCDYKIDWNLHIGQIVDSKSLVDTAGMLSFWSDDEQLLKREFYNIKNYQPVTCQ